MNKQNARELLISKLSPKVRPVLMTGDEETFILYREIGSF